MSEALPRVRGVQSQVAHLQWWAGPCGPHASQASRRPIPSGLAHITKGVRLASRRKHQISEALPCMLLASGVLYPPPPHPHMLGRVREDCIQ